MADFLATKIIDFTADLSISHLEVLTWFQIYNYGLLHFNEQVLFYFYFKIYSMLIIKINVTSNIDYIKLIDASEIDHNSYNFF